MLVVVVLATVNAATATACGASLCQENQYDCEKAQETHYPTSNPGNDVDVRDADASDADVADGHAAGDADAGADAA
jgi:hypothetical protein